MRLRHQAIPKNGGKGVRVLSIPTIRDRVVQGAFKLILEPIFEADFQPGSYGYRPKRSAHVAVVRVAEAIVKYKTRVIDVDLHAYFENIRHHILLAKVAQRVNDPDVLHGLKIIAEAGFIKDARCEDALDLLETKQLKNGGFPAESKYYRVSKNRGGRSLVDWGPVSPKTMNEFVTIDALSVLKEAGRWKP